MRRNTWDIGNLFAVPLSDGSSCLGQIVGREAQMLNSITCAFYRTRVDSAAIESPQGVPDQQDLIAVQFTTKDLLTRRIWKVLGNFPVTLPQSLFPHEDKRAQNWMGATMVGSGNIDHFLNAYFGLEPWDQMHDPEYFDSLLLLPASRPKWVKFSS